jgi:hypothetical protein
VTTQQALVGDQGDATKLVMHCTVCGCRHPCCSFNVVVVVVVVVVVAVGIGMVS